MASSNRMILRTVVAADNSKLSRLPEVGTFITYPISILPSSAAGFGRSYMRTRESRRSTIHSCFRRAAARVFPEYIVAVSVTTILGAG